MGQCTQHFQRETKELVQSEIFDSLGRSAKPILLRLQAESVLQSGGAALRKQGTAGDIREAMQLQQTIFGISLSFQSGTPS